MSSFDSSESRSSSPAPSALGENPPLSDVQLSTPPVNTLPCQFQPTCPDQCPAFEPVKPGSKRCICGHIHTLHRLPLPQENTSAVLPEPGSSSALLPAAKSTRWAVKAMSAKQKIQEAQAEVKAGYSSGPKGKGRPAKPHVQENKKIKPSARVSSSTRPRHLPKEPVNLIVFVEHAIEGLTETTNNQGEKVVEFSDVRALNKSQIASLMGTPLGRFNTPADELWLDPTLDAQQTAEHLAVLFSDIYDLVKTGDAVPQGWFVQLVKDQRRLHSISHRVGATAHQLLVSASTDARRKDSREIYLAIPIKFTKRIRESLGLPPSKRKVSDSDSEEESMGLKVQRTSAAGNSSRVASGSGTLPRISTQSLTVKRGKARIPSRIISPRAVTPRPQSSSPAPSTIVDDTEGNAPASPVPTSPAKTEATELDMAELEEATSSFVLDDREVVDLTAPTPPSSPLTRSKQHRNTAKVAQDLVLASLMDNEDVNVFSDSYNP